MTVILDPHHGHGHGHGHGQGIFIEAQQRTRDLQGPCLGGHDHVVKVNGFIYLSTTIVN